MESDKISIRGAREHNLRNLDLDIPRDVFTVITGVSGSGKSSLAFDTIYAEGQRRYVESLSAYARQFLEQMKKPDADHIAGLPPTIAIEQRKGVGNPRSTVATTTEIYDYLRLLYARVGDPHCHVCGKPIRRQTAQQITDQIMQWPADTRLMVMSPLVRGRKGEHKDIIARAKREGYARLRIDGTLVEARDIKEIQDKKRKHDIEAVVDRLVMKPDIRSRLAESVETALRLGEGLCVATALAPNGDWKDTLFSEIYACPDCSVSVAELAPRMFSFNNPYGACEACGGLGTKLELDPDLIVPDVGLSLQDGAIDAWRKGGKRMAIWYSHVLKDFAAGYGVPLTTPWQDLSEKVQKILLYGDPQSKDGPGFEGVIPNLDHRFHATESEFVKQRIHQYMSVQPCPVCKGARLKPEALAVYIGKLSIRDFTSLSIGEAVAFVRALSGRKAERHAGKLELPQELKGEKAEISRPILREIENRLGFLEGVGLEYLSLDRTAGSLSGGEFQRIRLASQVGSGLVGVCYVLDEPTIGLHQRDNERLLKTLLSMRDLGNTVIVVEHDEDVIRAADHLLDLGPGAGVMGGKLIAQGTVAEVMASPASLTGAYLTGEMAIEVPKARRPRNPRNGIHIRGAKENNLKSINVDFPLGAFTCVTGVSGSGKSTLVNEILYKALARQLNGSRVKPGQHGKVAGIGNLERVIEIDQDPIGKTPRSNPATYTGLFDDIRRLYAKVPEARLRGYDAGRFSFNVKGGRCEACQGQGVMKIEMHFLPDMYVTCEECKGTRYNRETLEIKYKGLNISQALELPIAEAMEFFKSIPSLRDTLLTLNDVGLGYVALGQSSTTLSGGEAQRVKLASELCKRGGEGTVYVLDEPTTGLHFADIQKLINVLNRLVDRGSTVIVIEHNLDVIKCADYIVDLGPEGGERGGELVTCGTPEEVAQNPISHTGKYLARVLAVQKRTKKTGKGA